MTAAAKEAAANGDEGRQMRIGILTVSDLGAVGQRADTSGDTILQWAAEHGYEVVVRSVVSDETDRIAGKLVRRRPIWSEMRPKKNSAPMLPTT